MWWRFLTFCVLVTVVLFIVLSCIHGRPVIHLFFHRCCEEDIENDQVIFENFGNNFLRERLVGDEIVVEGNAKEGLVSESDVEEAMNVMREKLNVHDLNTRFKIFSVGKPKTKINYDLIEESLTKDLESQLNELELEGSNTFNDVNYTLNDTSGNDVTQRVLSVTSENAVTETTLDESIEVTTEKRSDIKYPIKLIDVSSSYVYNSDSNKNNSVT